MEGPYAEFTGYVAGDRSPKPTIRVTCITHRNDPILRGTIEGCMPGSFSENAMISLDHALRDRLERARPRRRARHHRRLGPAGAGRHEPDGPDEADLSRPGQAGRQCDLGKLGRACALQARHRGRRRHRHPRLCGGRLGDRLPGQCRRERHRHHAGDVRARARSLDPQARPQPDAVRHRQMEPRADRCHHQPRLRSRSRFRRRALSADRVAGRRRTSTPPRRAGASSGSTSAKR